MAGMFFGLGLGTPLATGMFVTVCVCGCVPLEPHVHTRVHAHRNVCRVAPNTCMRPRSHVHAYMCGHIDGRFYNLHLRQEHHLPNGAFPTCRRNTALHYAAARNHSTMARILLAFGADPSAKNALGATPSDLAARAGHSELVGLLGKMARGEQGSVPELEEFEGLGEVGTAAGPADLEVAARKDWQAESHQTAAGPVLSMGAGGSGAVAGPAPATSGAAATPMAASTTAPSASAVAGRAAEPAPPAKSVLPPEAKRSWEGVGSPGTRLKPNMRAFRVVAVLERLAVSAYLIWRATRTLTQGWMYFYSIPFLLCEVSRRWC